MELASGTSNKEKEIGTKENIMIVMEMLKSKSHPNAVYHPPSVVCAFPDREIRNANRQVGTEVFVVASLFDVVMRLRNIKNYSLCGLFR